jgi:NAD(P)-dependent dehydrogenase (short-subunit alcohol dehydrogenase family)
LAPEHLTAELLRRMIINRIRRGHRVEVARLALPLRSALGLDQVSEIAKLAVYRASDDSAYVVGADFLIDGGVTAISAVGA